ncbi:hypothetical protein CCHR01_13079 [Colletotrichum chrysophilum]|uniref:Uncharacterized protein n=1 Tax=Colletotrichum chrysophilum TaxID=1836956 RepID=A0AAD9AA21_9PEZI|nr:hypothetical protein CCHR01_13079 [Colletotrichum chrysophilum]
MTDCAKYQIRRKGSPSTVQIPKPPAWENASRDTHSLVFITHSCGTGGESPCLFLAMFACLAVNNSPAYFGSAHGKVSHRRPQFDKKPMIGRDHRLIQKATGNLFTTRDCSVCPHRAWSRFFLSIALQRTVGKVATSLHSVRHGTQGKRNSSPKSKCQVCQLGTPSKSARDIPIESHLACQPHHLDLPSSLTAPISWSNSPVDCRCCHVTRHIMEV